ncbi:hypothetical protein [Actinomadura sp. 3N407]|uniref:hypothetical protein n=1 Tax=Actinomadura sp. 3N407 TaxID=3457423 RepID=UPI003FCE6D59
MRLDILNRGYGPGTKLLFALIRLFSRHPVPDAARLVFYRPDFYGARGCAAFNITDRLADAFGFELLTPEGFEAGAKYLLKRGYR